MLNLAQIKQHDSEDMLHLLSTFSEQCRRGWEIGESLDLAGCDARIPNNIVIAGMGGSGIGGDLVKAVVGAGLPCPIIVHRGYTLPAFVSSQTLFVAVSYSGNTEETLLSLEAAFAQGAKILAVTSGGKLKGFAAANGLPCLMIPAGQPPRASLGYLLMPILSVFAQFGFTPDLNLQSDLEEAVTLLASLATNFHPNNPENQPKQLAHALHGKLPVIYASQELEAIAMRWKGQMNENGKSLAYYSVYPEMNHNEIEGWKHPPALTQACHVLQLRDPAAPSQTQRRMDITAELIQSYTGGITQVHSEGTSLLARLLSLVAIGDWASYYLAILYQQNPTPVRRIEELKRRLET